MTLDLLHLNIFVGVCVYVIGGHWQDHPHPNAETANSTEMIWQNFQNYNCSTLAEVQGDRHARTLQVRYGL